jgi:hypothetical protein
MRIGAVPIFTSSLNTIVNPSDRRSSDMNVKSETRYAGPATTGDDNLTRAILKQT